jgi:hypothetical protein
MGDNTVYYYNEKLLVKGNESDDYKCAQMEELTFGTAWDSKWKSFVIQGYDGTRPYCKHYTCWEEIDGM